MPNDSQLKALIADGLLLGLAILESDDDRLASSTATREMCLGFMAVAQQALGDACRTSGSKAADVLAEVRSTAVGMAEEGTFAEAAETMWVAGLLEASRTSADLFAQGIEPCYEHAVAGLAAAAQILLIVSARLHGISEEDLIARYRAGAVHVIASS
ncbi:MAG TPA: hypothetical protein VF867_13200 [Arthrobacter sp.]